MLPDHSLIHFSPFLLTFLLQFSCTFGTMTMRLHTHPRHRSFYHRIRLQTAKTRMYLSKPPRRGRHYNRHYHHYHHISFIPIYQCLSSSLLLFCVRSHPLVDSALALVEPLSTSSLISYHITSISLIILSLTTNPSRSRYSANCQKQTVSSTWYVV